jgi:hypothetical protein
MNKFIHTSILILSLFTSSLAKEKVIIGMLASSGLPRHPILKYVTKDHSSEEVDLLKDLLGHNYEAYRKNIESLISAGMDNHIHIRLKADDGRWYDLYTPSELQKELISEEPFNPNSVTTHKFTCTPIIVGERTIYKVTAIERSSSLTPRQK